MKRTPEQEKAWQAERQKTLAKIRGREAYYALHAEKLADEFLEGMVHTEEEIFPLITALLRKAVVHAYFRGVDAGRRCGVCGEFMECPVHNCKPREKA